MRIQDEEGIIMKDRSYFSKYKTKTVANMKEIPKVLCWNPSGIHFLVASVDIVQFNIEKLFSHAFKRVFQSKHGCQNSKVKFINEESFFTMSREKIKLWDRREKSQNNGITVYMVKDKSRLLDIQLFEKIDSQIIFLNDENLIQIYDIRKGASYKTIQPNIETYCLLWNKKYSSLLCGGASLTKECFPGELAIYNSDFTPLTNFSIHGLPIRALAINPDFSCVATTSDDMTLQLHSSPDILNERTYSLIDEGVPYDLSFNYNGQFISVGYGKKISIYNVKKGGEAYRINCQVSQKSVVWSPKKNILAYMDLQKQGQSQYKSYSVNFFAP